MIENKTMGKNEGSLLTKDAPDNPAFAERVQKIVESIDTMSIDNRCAVLDLMGGSRLNRAFRSGRRRSPDGGITTISRQEAIRQTFLMYADEKLVEEYGASFGIPTLKRELYERSHELFNLSPETIGKIEDVLNPGMPQEKSEPADESLMYVI
jgi:hypothetical protein